MSKHKGVPRNTILVLNDELVFQLDLVIEHYAGEFGDVDLKGVCTTTSLMPADIEEMEQLTIILTQLRKDK